MKDFLWWLICWIWSPGIAGACAVFGAFYGPVVAESIVGDVPSRVTWGAVGMMVGLLVVPLVVAALQFLLLLSIGRPDYFTSDYNPSPVHDDFYDRHDGIG
ncbi:MAG: hypothetical protein ACRD43_00015 [Pyrinomonadaceae bacterium]